MDGDESDITAARDAEIARRDREWAAGAPAPHQGPTGGPPTGALGSDTEPGTYRTPKHLRPSRGPRFSGKGVLAVFGILGVLLALGIMALLAVKVLDSVSGSSGDPVPPDVTRIDPGAEVDPGNQVDPNARIDPGAPVDRAQASSCKVGHDTIETASDAYEIAEGQKPSTIDQLVAAGYLEPPDGGFSHEISQDGSVLGVGVCAGT